jgi:gamma-glutamylcyclotransferase (GGCT)/AIG2-like uncharacterized protein YtfP
MNKHLVFVYGSLRRGSVGAMSIRFPNSKFIANAQVIGSLYDLGTYPGLLLDDSKSLVTGEVYEVYEVDDEILNQLDEFEASSEYLRRQVDVYIGNDITKSWIYVPQYSSEFNSHRTLITSGDWMEYSRTQTD